MEIYDAYVSSTSEIESLIKISINSSAIDVIEYNRIVIRGLQPTIRSTLMTPVKGVDGEAKRNEFRRPEAVHCHLSSCIRTNTISVNLLQVIVLQIVAFNYSELMNCCVDKSIHLHTFEAPVGLVCLN